MVQEVDSYAAIKFVPKTNFKNNGVPIYEIRKVVKSVSKGLVVGFVKSVRVCSFFV